MPFEGFVYLLGSSFIPGGECVGSLADAVAFQPLD
jgi:hypothetical protein